MESQQFNSLRIAIQLKTSKSLRGVNELEETLINLHSFNQIK